MKEYLNKKDTPIGYIEKIFAYHYRDVFYMVNKYYGPKLIQKVGQTVCHT